ncbi:MAG: CHRD domain-containing protein [Gemmatimonadales bacterium]
MRRIENGAAAIVLAVALGVGCNGDANGPDFETEFEASLTGAAERPNPVTTTAMGTATVTIDDDAQTISFTINVTGLVSPTVAHIHVGSTTEAGPPVVTLYSPAQPPVGPFTGQLATGTRLATDVTGGETFGSLVAKIRAGNAYINVHTVANAGGEIRGQLVPES